MSLYAVIEMSSNVVSNVIVLENIDSWSAPENTYIVNIEELKVGIGFMYNREIGEWIAPIMPGTCYYIKLIKYNY
jgi:hypothetical protein